MPLLDFLATSNTFRQWLHTTNNLISTISNTSVFILVSQNATPNTTTGNVSINGTMSIVTVTANGTVTANVFSGNGVSITSLNATALATGTVPDARLLGTYTLITANNSTYAFGKSEGALNVNNALTANQSTYLAGAAVTGNSTALTVGANVYVNQSTLFVGNSIANSVLTSISFSVANSTNTATMTPISFTVGTQVANTKGFHAGANVYANTTTFFVGNSSSNVVIAAGSLTINGTAVTPVSLDPVVAAIALG
jgi:hypothetical protein